MSALRDLNVFISNTLLQISFVWTRWFLESKGWLAVWQMIGYHEFYRLDLTSEKE
jgi:hypothetical protein